MKTNREKRTGGFFSRHLFLVLSLVLVGIATVAMLVLNDQVERGVHRSKSRDNISSLIYSMKTDDRSIPQDHLRHTGRNFILTVVASGAIEANNWRAVGVLWPPSSDRASEINLRAYEQVSWKSLESRRFPHLTGYAGPRHAPASGGEGTVKGLGTPLIADLTHPDGILVGFRDRRVTFLTWKELDMDRPDGPVVVGPGATHPLLRALSND